MGFTHSSDRTQQPNNGQQQRCDESDINKYVFQFYFPRVHYTSSENSVLVLGIYRKGQENKEISCI